MNSFRLSRRAVLRGAGSVAVALPWMECMMAKKAHAAGPQRLVVFFTPNGCIYNNWKPTGVGTNFQLSTTLKPLEPFKDKLTILDGLYQGDNGNIGGPGDDHMMGMAWMLTGRRLMPGTVVGGGGTPAGLANGISVDQAIANKIGGATKFKSLEFGVHSLTVAGNPLFHMVYSGAGQAIQPQQNAANMFDRVFGTFTPPTGGGTPTADPAAAKKLADASSVLDGVIGSYTALQPKLGATDKAKLDQHLTHIRELEKRIKSDPGVSGPAVSAACTKPAKPPTVDAYSEANYVAIGKAQTEMLTMALACDLTRVASLQWSYSSGGPTFSWLGHSKGHHDYSHDGDGVADSQKKLSEIDLWYAGQYASLLSGMSKIQEGDKTMLDNSTVIWVNEITKGNTHSHNPMCQVIAGSGGGKMPTGRYLQTKAPHNNLLVSLMNLMDVPGTTFGDPQFCTGPLNGLV